MNERTRLKPEDRKAAILDAAIAEAEAVGYRSFTREGVTNRAQCSPGLLNTYFGTMKQLKRAVMRAAVDREVIPIVAAGLAEQDPQALKASKALRARAVAHLTA